MCVKLLLLFTGLLISNQLLLFTGLLISLWIYSLLWSVPPFFGWGYFTLDGGQVSCCFDYLTRNANNISYIIAMFVFCFGIQVKVSLSSLSTHLACLFTWVVGVLYHWLQVKVIFSSLLPHLARLFFWLGGYTISSGYKSACHHYHIQLLVFQLVRIEWYTQFTFYRPWSQTYFQRANELKNIRQLII